MASLLVANLCRRTATTRSATCCYAARRRFLLQNHVQQRRNFGVAICNLTHSKKLEKIISTQQIQQRRQQNRWLSSVLQESDSDSDDNEGNNTANNSDNSQYASHPCFPRLRSLRNVGVFAHVDAGKTTVTERMLALSGIVRNAGSVDDGDTVTDYLPAERERGITIQSAAVGFGWVLPTRNKEDTASERSVEINLIDTQVTLTFQSKLIDP
ncbi:translation elongation factor G [Skeletonema marinoi]|uniref:Translation elongation factor G n=1 Tax=Skeletonema marinoi TaxID=267567 RepID=A0AAD8YE81_9STRA|nr:translation elongation factor G [Skeletonema marinoi]